MTATDDDVIKLHGVYCQLPSTPYLPEYCLSDRKLADGRIAIGYLESEDDAENPFDDGSWYRIGSFNRNHSNFVKNEKDGMQHITEANIHMLVRLSYYEHSGSLWYVQGCAPAGANCPWDSVALAGVWIPGKECIEYIRHSAIRELVGELTGGKAWLQHRTRERAACMRWLKRHPEAQSMLAHKGHTMESALKGAETVIAEDYATKACAVWTAYTNGNVYRVRQVICSPDGAVVEEVMGPDGSEPSEVYYGSDPAEVAIKEWLASLQ